MKHEWLVDGCTVYALNEHGVNHFSALVQPGLPRPTVDELERIAILMRAAPDLLEALISIADQLERIGDSRKDAPFIEAARSAIAKAQGERP